MTETTHCANCGAEVPVDMPHRLGECHAPTVTLTEFLLARIAEDEEAVRFAVETFEAWCWGGPDRVLAECEAKRRIVEFHKSWPVLVESPPKFETASADDVNAMSMRMSQQIAWATEQEYRVKFATEPPTAPMLRALAAVYADHPDYREEWRP